MSKQKEQQAPPAGMRAVTEKSVLPILAIGAVWLLWALLFPLYTVGQYLLCAAVSAGVYFLLRGILPDKVRYEPIPQVTTGDALADELLKQGQDALDQTSRAADGIRNAAVREKIEDLEDTCGRILDYVRKNPKSAGSQRRFLGYYLPTLQKLVTTYALMEQQGVEGENISGSMERIEELLDTLDGAFRKQLDALFGDTALDIDSDITVMESLMAREGLTEQPSPGTAAADTIPDPLAASAAPAAPAAPAQPQPAPADQIQLKL